MFADCEEMNNAQSAVSRAIFVLLYFCIFAQTSGQISHFAHYISLLEIYFWKEFLLFTDVIKILI